MKIADIKPCPHNERDHSKGIDELVESIKDAGFHGMIALRSHDDPTIVIGHGRVEALKRLGWTEIPERQIDWLDDLTDEQIERYRINDNKTGELSTWNRAALRASVKKMELKGVDMSRFGYNFKSLHRPFGAERLRTDHAYNLDICNRDSCDGLYPVLDAEDIVPHTLSGFNYAKSTDAKEKAKQTCHFFLDDYQFERIWREPKRYLGVLKDYEAVLTPDFSMYLDMPLPMMQWNHYRSLALGSWWQKMGLCVIPTLSWADDATYSFCFDGIPHNATVAVSTVGVMRDKQATNFWLKGAKAAKRVLKPKRVLVYGCSLEFDWGCEVIPYRASTKKEGGKSGR